MRTCKKLFIVMVLFLISLCVPKGVVSQSSLSLSGFDTLPVVVEVLHPAAAATGLTVDQIKTDVEIRLRRAGLKVGTKPNNYVYLYIAVSSVSTDFSGVAGSVNTALKQMVALERNKNVVFMTTTWETGGAFVIAKTNPQFIRGMISDQVDKFINAYLEANESSQNNAKETDELADFLAGKGKPTSPQKQDDSPFTATYVGGNKQPEVEVFNDSNRTLYLDLGQQKMTAYTIPSGESKKIPLTEGYYNFKASAVRVRTLTGRDLFKKGYSYTWRFTIITVPR